MNKPRLLRFFVPILILSALASQGRAQSTVVPGKPPSAAMGSANVNVFLESRDLPSRVRTQLDAFFDSLGEHKVDAAYDTLLKGTAIAQHPQDVAALKAKSQQAISMFGDIAGYDVAGIKYLGKHLLLATCLSLGRDFPLRWKFYFYTQEGQDNWRLLDIRVDDQLSDMFGETPPKSAGTRGATVELPGQ